MLGYISVLLKNICYGIFIIRLHVQTICISDSPPNSFIPGTVDKLTSNTVQMFKLSKCCNHSYQFGIVVTIATSLALLIIHFSSSTTLQKSA